MSRSALPNGRTLAAGALVAGLFAACGARSDLSELDALTPLGSSTSAEPLTPLDVTAVRSNVEDTPVTAGRHSGAAGMVPTAPREPRPGPGDGPRSTGSPSGTLVGGAPDPVVSQGAGATRGEPPTAPTTPANAGGEGSGGATSGAATDGEPSPEDAARLWLYVDDGTGRLLNLYDLDERFAVPRVNATDTLLHPWSGDGSRLAYFEDHAVVFVDLETGRELRHDNTGTEMTVHGWVDGVGTLIGYYYEGVPVLYLGKETGGFVMLAEAPPASSVVRASVSPQANALLYTALEDDVSHVYWVPLADSVGSPIEILTTAGDSMTNVLWSADGQWAAFDDDESGTWQLVNAADPTLLTELGPRSEWLEFSPKSPWLVFQNGPSLELVALDGPGDVAHTTLDDAAADARARFSDDGAHLYYPISASTAALHALGAEGLAGSSAIEDFAAECPLTWTGPLSFVYQLCGSPERGFAAVRRGDSRWVSTVYNDSLRHDLVLGPARRCFANWEDETLDVGSYELPLEVEFTHTAGSEITQVALSPNDDAVVWVENTDRLYWLPLNDDCDAASSPQLLSDERAIVQAKFVAAFPR